MTGGGECYLISAKTAAEHFPELESITPRPEPDYNDVDAWETWNNEYQLWGSVKCACKTGYFCRAHGEWITGEDIKKGNAPYQEHEGHYSCPHRHYYPEIPNAESQRPSRHRESKRKARCMCSEPCPPAHENRRRESARSTVAPQATRRQSASQTTQRHRHSSGTHSSSGPTTKEMDESRDAFYAPRSRQESISNVQGQYAPEPSSYNYLTASDYQFDNPVDNPVDNPGIAGAYDDPQTLNLVSGREDYELAYDHYDSYDHDNPSPDLPRPSGSYYSYESPSDRTGTGAGWVYTNPLDHVSEGLDQLDLGSTLAKHSLPANEPSQTDEKGVTPERRSKQSKSNADDKKSSGSKSHKSRDSKDSSKRKSKDKR